MNQLCGGFNTCTLSLPLLLLVVGSTSPLLGSGQALVTALTVAEARLSDFQGRSHKCHDAACTLFLGHPVWGHTATRESDDPELPFGEEVRGTRRPHAHVCPAPAAALAHSQHQACPDDFSPQPLSPSVFECFQLRPQTPWSRDKLSGCVLSNFLTRRIYTCNKMVVVCR